MTRKVNILYRKKVFQKAHRCFWRRLIGYDLLGGFLIIIAAFCFCIYEGDYSWYVAIMGNFILFVFLLLPPLYLITFKRHFSLFEKLTELEVVFEFQWDGITMTSRLGSSFLPWNEVDGVWCFSEMWIIFVDNKMYAPLPTSNLTSELQEFIVQQVKHYGGQIE